MPRPASPPAPRVDLTGEPECRCELRGAEPGEISFEQGGENDDGAFDIEASQLLAFRNRRNSVAPRLERIECAHGGFRAEAVGVGLDHREKRNTSATGQCCSITLQRAQIDLDPGASNYRLH